MVIVFFGTPQFAVPTLERLLSSRHEVRGVVTQPDRPRGRGQKFADAPVKAAALAHGVPVFQPERLRDPEVERTLAGWSPDLGVVAAYGKLIPSNLLRLPRFGMINVHASLLPKYRGASPVHRAVIDGEAQTGVTIMQMVEALDAGDMLAAISRPIQSDETSEAVEHDLAHLGAHLLVDVVARIEAGAVTPVPQDDGASTYAPRLTKEEGLVDWTLSAPRIHNRVRGLYPWPHAYAYLDGARIILLKTHVVGDSTSAEPGKVIDVSRDAIRVATGHGGVIAIDELQPEGKRPMRTRDFLAGRPLQPGGRFR
jgi:methionyl-tRNA formyltransferase